MITLPSLSGEKYFVLGLGKSGLATAASLKASGAEVLVWDDYPLPQEEAKRAGYTLANPAEASLSGVTALILSPGIPHTFPAPHLAVARCLGAKVPVLGDMDLLFRACPKATYVGVTGTNGKSTTTSLIAHILKTAGRKVQVGGNLGTPALSFDMLGEDGIYVLELSSYQLDLMHTNPLSVAVLLNFTPDHLDRHGDMAGYVAAKKRILRQDGPQTLVIGDGEPETRAVAEEARAQRNLRVENIASQKPLMEPFVKWGDLTTLPGAHNQQNASAAFAACRALGVSPEDIAKGLKSFPGLAHRQQLIATLKGVRFINDSKATNADAASKALGCYNDIYWIIGGKPKAGGLNGLESFMPRVRHAFLISAATDEFAGWCDGKVAYTRCGTLDVAVQKAAEMAWTDGKKDAVVLLSPACASFDQFPNFEERGRIFGDLVRAL